MAQDKMTRVQLTGLWWNETQNGDQYLRGRLGNATIWIFKNNYKEQGDNKPDMIMYLSAAPKKDDDRRDPPEDNRGPGGGKQEGDSDIPF
jgi:hypothetical protein